MRSQPEESNLPAQSKSGKNIGTGQNASWLFLLIITAGGFVGYLNSILLGIPASAAIAFGVFIGILVLVIANPLAQAGRISNSAKQISAKRANAFSVFTTFD